MPEGGKSISQIAKLNGISPAMLAHYLNSDSENIRNSGEIIEIPARGYTMSQAWFFMDQEVFDSLLVQGFLMQDLNENLFETIFTSPWGKIYKIKN